MKKRLTILLLLVGLVLIIFSFSTNFFAIKNDTSYKDGQIIAVSDSLDDSYLTRDDSHYEDGQIIAASEDITDNSLTPLGFYLYKDKTIEVFYANYYDVPQTYY